MDEKCIRNFSNVTLLWAFSRLEHCEIITKICHKYKENQRSLGKKTVQAKCHDRSGSSPPPGGGGGGRSSSSKLFPRVLRRGRGTAT